MSHSSGPHRLPSVAALQLESLEERQVPSLLGLASVASQELPQEGCSPPGAIHRAVPVTFDDARSPASEAVWSPAANSVAVAALPFAQGVLTRVAPTFTLAEDGQTSNGLDGTGATPGVLVWLEAAVKLDVRASPLTVTARIAENPVSGVTGALQYRSGLSTDRIDQSTAGELAIHTLNSVELDSPVPGVARATLAGSATAAERVISNDLGISPATRDAVGGAAVLESIRLSAAHSGGESAPRAADSGQSCVTGSAISTVTLDATLAAAVGLHAGPAAAGAESPASGSPEPADAAVMLLGAESASTDQHPSPGPEPDVFAADDDAVAPTPGDGLSDPPLGTKAPSTHFASLTPVERAHPLVNWLTRLGGIPWLVALGVSLVAAEAARRARIVRDLGWAGVRLASAPRLPEER